MAKRNYIMKTNIHPDQTLDIIGDIHGHATELEALLLELGYNEGADCFRHPNGRQVVFLGDYIDRGPEIRRTLEIVRGMIDAGEAYGILGNHELNALRYHHVGPEGAPLRKNAGSKKARLAHVVGQSVTGVHEFLTMRASSSSPSVSTAGPGCRNIVLSISWMRSFTTAGT